MKKNSWFRRPGLLAGFIFCFSFLSAEAALFTVTVNRSNFSPATLTVSVGDTVTWENQDIFDDSHSATSDLPVLNANYWDALLVGAGETFDHVFNNVGTFTYHDNFDSGHGTIIVQAVTVVPVIILNSPRKTASQFLFDATGLTVGKTSVLQASTNLTGWTAIKTNVANNASMTFTNAMTGPGRFFRLMELP